MAGDVTTSTVTFAAELAGDLAIEIGAATLGVIYETVGGRARYGLFAGR